MAIPIRKYVRRSLGAAILLASLAWTADWLVLRHKVNADGDAFGDVEVRYRFNVHLRNRQIEQRSEKPQSVECVNSVFPHYDESPCWYLQRHANQIEDLDGGPWHFWSDDRP
jgi:hypothetical protein